jgi:hypothetical protein
MSERQFKDNVNKKVQVHKQTTYTPYFRGTPDHWYSGNETDLWVEYKFVPRVPNELQWKSYLSKLQLRWCTERHSEGRNVWIIVGIASNVEGIILKTPRSRLLKAGIIKRLQRVDEIAHTINNFCGRCLTRK